MTENATSISEVRSSFEAEHVNKIYGKRNVHFTSNSDMRTSEVPKTRVSLSIHKVRIEECLITPF